MLLCQRTAPALLTTARFPIAHDTAGNTWTENVAGCTSLYQPTGESVTVPSSRGAPAGTSPVSDVAKIFNW